MNERKPQKVSRAPPPPTPIRGTGSTGIRYDRPNWPIWRRMQSVTLPEAIALSLDVEPGRGRIQDFDLRLLLAMRDDTLPKTIIAPDGSPMVDLAAFASWALGAGLQIPPELVALPGDDKMRQDMQDAANKIAARGDRPSKRKVAEAAGYDRGGAKFKRLWDELNKDDWTL